MGLTRSVQEQRRVFLVGLGTGAVLIALGFTLAFLTMSRVGATHDASGSVHACVNNYTGQARIMRPGQAPNCTGAEFLVELGGGAAAVDVEARLSALEEQVPDCLAEESGDAVFTNCDVEIRDGLGSTATQNGKGNLIVGYNENENSFVRTGSHNIVVGTGNGYSSWGGLVAGRTNQITNEWATVSGGQGNTASGIGASVSGGENNKATSNRASVSGGVGNHAIASDASVSGGAFNTASGLTSNVSGGSSNIASGATSSVSGGYQNTASELRSSVSGGLNNEASGENSSVSGGESNNASGDESSVTGGKDNVASGISSSVSGGISNQSSGPSSSVSGGFLNNASGDESSISGGYF